MTHKAPRIKSILNTCIIVPPDRKDASYARVFGATIKDIKGVSFDWRIYEPELEKQGNTSDCTCFSRLNCAEMVAKKAGVLDDDGNEFNLSELFLAVGSGTSPQGNNLKAPSEFFRKEGVVLKKFCDYSGVMLTDPAGTWNLRSIKYLAAKKNKRYLGGNWSWVKPTTELLKDALQYSPIQIAVGLDDKWNTADVVSAPVKYYGYHAITLVYIDEKDQYVVYDHYDKKYKTLAANYPILQAISYRDLVEGWRGNGVDDALFYNRMVGKLIILPERNGEVFRIFETYMQKVNFSCTDKPFWDLITKLWQINKVFLGVSNKDFDRLAKVAFANEGIKNAGSPITFGNTDCTYPLENFTIINN